jgi:hypothetical protein
MPGFFMRKVSGSMLAAADEEAEQALSRFKLNEPVKVTLKRPRNIAFHRKFFALLNYGFEYWSPAPLPPDPERKWMKNVTPEKSFEQFRKDVTILAGFYTASYRLDGTVRIEAKSISFASMGEDEFEDLFSKAIDVLLKHVFANSDMSEEQLREITEDLVRFAA